jgi:hypothetical protein
MSDPSFRQLATELQQRLGTIPSSGNVSPGRTTYSAYLIRKIHALKLKMYQEPGHALPHIHIDHGPQHHMASFSISPAKRLEGSLDARSEYIVLDWIATNKDSLLSAWQSLQDGTPDYAVLAELKAGA